MGLKKNIPFVIAMVVIGVIFVAVAVVVQRLYAGLSHAKQTDRQVEDKLGEVEKRSPTPEHRDYAKDQLTKSEQAFETLKQTMRVWWDAGIYEEDRTPGIFLGNLQELRRRIALFAEGQDPPVLLAEGVPLMGFEELRTSVPPAEVTFDMLKQQSVMRDIILLLIQNKVYSINSIAWLGPEKGSKLYTKYMVTVSFTCKYPQLAKFQADLVKASRTQVALRGARGERTESFELPRNFLVIEQLSYTADDLKIARLTAAGSPASTGTTGPYGHGTGTGSMRPPGSEPVSSAETIVPPGTNPYTGSMRPPTGGSGTSPYTSRDTRKTESQGPKKEGREPQYNVLNVTMTISMVDFGEAIRGKLPVEDEKKTGGSTRPATQPPPGQ